jgi:hypothetical protein
MANQFGVTGFMAEGLMDLCTFSVTSLQMEKMDTNHWGTFNELCGMSFHETASML